MSTVQEILYDAMRLSGITRYAGRTPATDELTDAQRNLNRMLGSWSNERLLVQGLVRQVFDIAASTDAYTLGPDGDWNATRPIRIERAGLIESADETPLKLLDSNQWASISDKSLTSTQPDAIYDDRAHPLANIYPWPIPTLAAQVALYSWKPLAAVSALDEQIDLPPGYEDAIVYNLAVRLHGLWSHGEKTPLDPNVRQTAIDAKAQLKRLNNVPLLMQNDAPGVRCGDFDWRTGRTDTW